MRNFKATIAYVGTHYLVWQDTLQTSSIEGALTTALQTLLQHPVKLQAASRTDAGVHARGQVINFFSETTQPLGRLHHSLNCLLPKDIVVKILEEAPLTFHPTLD